MSLIIPDPKPEPTYDELVAEVEKMRQVMTAFEYARSFLRFHELDGLVNDSCPCCGGPVELDHSEVRRIDEHGKRAPCGTRLIARPWS